MKKMIAFILAPLLLAVTAVAETAEIIPMPSATAKGSFFIANTKGRSLLLEDGSILIAGYAPLADDKTQSEGMLLYMNPSGENTRMMPHAYADGMNRFSSLVPLPDGSIMTKNVYVPSDEASENGYDRKGILTIFRADGTVTQQADSLPSGIGHLYGGHEGILTTRQLPQGERPNGEPVFSSSLLEMDYDGSVLWEWVYDDELQIKGISLVDDGYYMYGAMYDKAAEEPAWIAMLARLDKQGEIDWLRTIPSRINTYFFDATVLADQGIIVTGFDDHMHSYVARYSWEGDEVWTSQYERAQTGACSAIIPYKDFYILAGRSDNASEFITISTMTGDGEIQATHGLRDENISAAMDGIDMHVCNEHVYVIASAAYSWEGAKEFLPILVVLSPGQLQNTTE